VFSASRHGACAYSVRVRWRSEDVRHAAWRERKEACAPVQRSEVLMPCCFAARLMLLPADTVVD